MSAAEELAPRHIMVINVSRIGDTLLTTPALRALAARWPGASIDFLGHPNRYEIIRYLPFVASAAPITKNRAPFKGWLARKRWDLALVYGFDRPLVAYALRAARRVVAFRQSDEKLDARLFRSVQRPGFQSVHAADFALALTRALDVPDAGRRLCYTVTPEERTWAARKLASLGAAGAHPLAGLQMASFPTKAFRDWPSGHFALLAQRVMAKWPGAHFLLFGGKADARRTREFAGRFPGRATSLAGELSLRQSAALMNELDLYLGVDTGPTHIMGALEAPMIALYHSHSPSFLLEPLERPGSYVVDHPRAGRDNSPEAPMAEISVDTVWAKVEQALAGGRFG